MWPLNNYSSIYPATQNAFRAPVPNSNFNFMPPQPQAKPGMGQPLGGIAPWGGNQQPFLPMNFNWPGLPSSNAPKGNEGIGNIKHAKATEAGDAKPSSVKGSINGNSFRSLDGERWEPAVKAGKTYELLSSGDLQVNGSYTMKNDRLILSQVGINTDKGQLTLGADGTLKIDGEDFSSRNDLKDTLKQKGNEYTLKTSEGYVIKLQASVEGGVSLKLEGGNGKAAGGLLGSANDGEKATEAELKKSLKPGDFEVDDVLTFEGDKSLDDDERSARLWASRNPNYEKMELKIDKQFSLAAEGKDVANWNMTALKADKPYLLFSEKDLNVSGTFDANQALKTVGVVIDGVARKVQINGSQNLEVLDSDNNPVKIPGFTGKSVAFEAFNSDGESYTITVEKKDGALALNIAGTGVGKNSTRSGGLLGDAVGIEADNGNDDNGMGYIRGEDGGLSNSKTKVSSALSGFELESLFDGNSERASTEVMEITKTGDTPSYNTYDNVLGRTWGDPHFHGADGELYDVRGKAGNIYNIMSDEGVQVNSQFGAWGVDGATVMKKLGFNVNGRQLEVGVDETTHAMTYKLDGAEITPANMPSWASITDGKLTVNSDYNGEKWQFTVDMVSDPDMGDHLNLDSKGIKIDDHVKTTGIWGDSIGKNDGYKLTEGVYQSGGGGILRNADGTTLSFDEKEGGAAHDAALANYTESDLFSTASKWSQFNR